MNKKYDIVTFEHLLDEFPSMLDYAVNDLDINIDNFFNMFLKSDIYEGFVKSDPFIILGHSGVELAIKIVEENKIEVINASSTLYLRDLSREYWLGQYLIMFIQETSNSLKEIFEKIKPSELLNLYNPYHEMDISSFVTEVNKRLNEIGNSRLFLLRQERKISQSDLAFRSSINLRTLQDYEQGRRDLKKASGVTLFNLASALDCKIEDLF